MSPEEHAAWLRDFCAAADALDADSVQVILNNARGLCVDVGEFELKDWGLLTAEGILEWIAGSDRSLVQTVQLTALKGTGHYLGADEETKYLMQKASEFPQMAAMSA